MNILFDWLLRQNGRSTQGLSGREAFHRIPGIELLGTDARGTPQVTENRPPRFREAKWEIMGGMRTSPKQAPAVGIDFGTTNSSVAMMGGDGTVDLVAFPSFDTVTTSFRSVLYLEKQESTAGVRRVHSLTGPSAIHRYLEVDEKGRLIQSLKSHLSSRSLTGTEIFGRRHKLEDLISRILKDLRKQAEEHLGQSIPTAVVGRPVHFVGADTPDDDDFAVARLRAAFLDAGFEQVFFEFEPVAAAHAYESMLERDELILIGDFGGGTSDFSLLRVGPSVRRRGRSPEDLLGNSGIGLAGDAFDARIIRKLVSPELGSNTEVRSFNKLLPAVPAWIYANLERWHYLSFLRTNNVREILKTARAQALEPEKIEALISLIDEDLGFQLHQAVQKTKFELSRATSAEFRFRDGSMNLRIPVTRTEFESSIKDELGFH